ncbi:ribbon-helix-helix protein, CopG family [Megasphaera massiliensis]|uniref:ribbon-helix-helix protein, CopG family n=1 Tax=Megasphaera massiliensis TaxID=1232428 RepID=UPI0036F1DB79
MEKQDTNKEKTKAIQFRIEESLLSRFNEITRRYSVNKSALIRQWIEKYIEQHEE